MRCCLLAVLWLSVLPGCAANTKDIYLSGRMDEQLRQVNRDTGGRTVHLVLRDGRSYEARGAVLSPDSTFWRTPDSGGEISVPSSELHRITFKSRKQGALRGLVIGILVGLPGGALVTDSGPGDQNVVIDRIQAALAGGLAGAIWGTPIGALVGRQVTYFIHPVDEGRPSGVGVRRPNGPGPFRVKDTLSIDVGKGR